MRFPRNPINPLSNCFSSLTKLSFLAADLCVSKIPKFLMLVINCYFGKIFSTSKLHKFLFISIVKERFFKSQFQYCRHLRGIINFMLVLIYQQACFLFLCLLPLMYLLTLHWIVLILYIIRIFAYLQTHIFSMKVVSLSEVFTWLPSHLLISQTDFVYQSLLVSFSDFSKTFIKVMPLVL